jgi:hypothetical protein
MKTKRKGNKQKEPDNNHERANPRLTQHHYEIQFGQVEHQAKPNK